ncbi:MAG: primosomal protein N' [Clostridia bacterium]|nr:primosomal protein N' [Clostridia bacterium]
MATVCEIRLLHSRREFDRGYSYLVPEELSVSRGDICAVPFGKANRPSFGLVVAIHEQQETNGLKEICFKLDAPYCLSEAMTDLCTYFSSHLLCSVGELAKCALPTGLTFRVREFISRAYDEMDECEFETAAQNDLYLLLKQGAKIEIVDRNRENCEFFLKRKLARRVYLPESAANEKYERVILLTSDPENLDQNAFARIPLAKADVYRKMLRYLRDIPAESVREKEICDRFQISKTSLASLEKRGLIRAEARAVYRTSYKEHNAPPPLDPLNPEQSASFDQIAAQMKQTKGSASLLFGVTGSGKTRVMLHLAKEALNQGKGVLFLVPEIGLTSNAAKDLLAHFPGEVTILHSGLSAGERHDAWVALKNGTRRIALGTRSAVFAPIKNLGLILMDEEQDQSYNADNAPRYHARDIARWRAAHEQAVLVLASATPDIETYYKAQSGTYSLCTLTERALKTRLPDVKIVDLREDLHSSPDRLIGSHLKACMEEALAKNEQILLFMNRRGYQYAPFCPSCGYVITCPNCSVSLTLHSHRGRYACCHYCGYSVSPPSKCPGCGAEHIFFKGFGTERLEEEVKELFPKARVLRMDADTVSQKLSHDKIIERFKEHKADILVGTQMIAKGHDFPNVTLVGIVMADTTLYLGDYRASEEAYALFTQVIGRAGRAKDSSLAIIQTLNPDHEIFSLAGSQDYQSFFEGEIALRRAVLYPPFCHLSSFTLTCEREEVLNKAATAFNDLIAEELEEHEEVKLIVYGPIDPAVLRVNNLYRKKFVVKHQNDRDTRALFARLLDRFAKLSFSGVSVYYDATPNQV